MSEKLKEYLKEIGYSLLCENFMSYCVDDCLKCPFVNQESLLKALNETP